VTGYHFSRNIVSTFRIALANVRYPATPDESVVVAVQAIRDAAKAGAGIVCFPECHVPGYRVPGQDYAAPNPAFLERAWATVREAAANAGIAVVLGTERMVEGRLGIAVLVINADGTIAGFQDKVQMDPSEDGIYSPSVGTERRVFQAGPLTFGVAICHEGWRYPETVRHAARAGAQLVFHPHYHWAEPGGYVASSFADPANTFHEKAALCRAAENTIYFASVNHAGPDSPTTSVVVNPDGTVLASQPYGVEGVLMADLDLTKATGLLAHRCRAPY
jgi:predicted amidohydrolase